MQARCYQLVGPYVKMNKYSFGDPCDGPNIDRLSVRACNTTEKVAKMSVFSLPVNNLTKLFGSNE